MTAKSDLIIAFEAGVCACPEETKSAECTREIKVGDHVGFIDADPDLEVYSAIPFCRPCWELAPSDDLT